MRKIIITEFLTLDGVMENPQWSFPYWGDDIAAFKAEETSNEQPILLIDVELVFPVEDQVTQLVSRSTCCWRCGISTHSLPPKQEGFSRGDEKTKVRLGHLPNIARMSAGMRKVRAKKVHNSVDKLSG